jgi:hypothetical protein
MSKRVFRHIPAQVSVQEFTSQLPSQDFTLLSFIPAKPLKRDYSTCFILTQDPVLIQQSEPAPFPKLPKKQHSQSKLENTIEEDADFLEFLNASSTTQQPSIIPTNNTTTPLLEYLKSKKSKKTRQKKKNRKKSKLQISLQLNK